MWPVACAADLPLQTVLPACLTAAPCTQPPACNLAPCPTMPACPADGAWQIAEASIAYGGVAPLTIMAPQVGVRMCRCVRACRACLPNWAGWHFA